MTELVLTNQYANLLLLLNGLVIILYIVARKRHRQRALMFGNYETLQKVAGKNFLKSSNIVLLIRLAALTAVILSISSPVLIDQKASPGSDFVIALDSSASMLSDDIEPSRLEAAKDISSNFVSRLPEKTQVGIVSFSGKVNTELKLTDRKKNASAVIRRIQTGESAGTAIGDVISASTTLLLDTNRSRSIILITDGRNNVGSSVNESVEFADRENITVNTIGIGSEGDNRSSYGMVAGENASRAQFPNLNQQQLRKISNRTGGEFQTVTNSSEFKSAFVELQEKETRTDFSRHLVFFAALLLVLEWVLATTRYSTLP